MYEQYIQITSNQSKPSPGEDFYQTNLLLCQNANKSFDQVISLMLYDNTSYAQ